MESASTSGAKPAEDSGQIVSSSSNESKSDVSDKHTTSGEQLNEEHQTSADQGVVEQQRHAAFHEDAYSVFTHNEKRIIILCAGICSFFSPVSGQIYFPALDSISKDLNVSYDLVNLSITTYLIMQGLAPAFIGGLSDNAGRRPAYVICFVIYMLANLGLALQSNYAALMVLRCVQSAGSSGTVALANAVVADVVTSAERGVYVSYMSVAPQAGPAIGPIIGGLLAMYLGWHSIFWFLLIVAGVVLIPMLFLFPETCRKIVEDGSVPPPRWSACWLNKRIEARLVREGQTVRYDRRDDLAQDRKLHFPNPLETVKIIFMKEAGFALIYIAIVCCGLYATTALIPSQFGTIYGFNEIQIALCYLPLGAGSMLAAFVRGRVIDSRFKVHAKRLGYPLDSSRLMDLTDFPIERARLEVALPTLALGSACIIGFGWMVQARVNLAGPLIFLFVIGFCISASMNTVAVLLVDVFPGKAGSATAANNLCRCWLGAASTSGVVPMINKVGMGWTTTFFGLLPIVFSPVLWYIMINGPKWRKRASQNREKDQSEKHGDDKDRADARDQSEPEIVESNAVSDSEKEGDTANSRSMDRASRSVNGTAEKEGAKN